MSVPTVHLHFDHPERCQAAKCTVPSFSDVVISVPTSAYGGQRFEQRICLGHYYAFQQLIAQLVRRGLRASILTAAEVAATRAQQRFSTMTVGGYATSNGVFTTTINGQTPWGF